MTRRKSFFAVTIVIILLPALFLVISSGCRKKSEDSATANGAHTNGGETHSHNTADNDAETMTLEEIIRYRRSWNPIFNAYYGKEAPNLSFTDLDGNMSSLEQWQGKDVLVVFWATWCGPCQAEVPHLKKLRNEYPESELEIIAISNEAESTVKRFASKNGLNYKVTSVQKELPEPFNYVRGIPSMVFINEQGRIKMGVEGMISPAEIKAIIKAEK